jgi:peroxiredoxin
MAKRVDSFLKADSELLNSFVSQDGRTFAALLGEQSVLVVFLRHFGCNFCREAVADIAEKRSAIEAAGSKLAFVHLGTEERATKYFAPYKLTDVPRFADPEGRLYQTFGLVRIQWWEILRWRALRRSLEALLHSGHFIGLPAGDIQRMPGVFLVQRGEIRKTFRHKLVSDRPDYAALATAR